MIAKRSWTWAASFQKMNMMLSEFPDDGWSHHLRPSVWILAFLGITYQQMFHERYKMLETCFYIFIGLVPALAVFEMVNIVK